MSLIIEESIGLRSEIENHMSVCEKNEWIEWTATSYHRHSIVTLGIADTATLAVGVDPEAERHVRVEHQVCNGTT